MFGRRLTLQVCSLTQPYITNPHWNCSTSLPTSLTPTATPPVRMSSLQRAQAGPPTDPNADLEPGRMNPPAEDEAAQRGGSGVGESMVERATKGKMATVMGKYVAAHLDQFAEPTHKLAPYGRPTGIRLLEV
jgi:hypothetical protein